MLSSVPEQQTQSVQKPKQDGVHPEALGTRSTGIQLTAVGKGKKQLSRTSLSLLPNWTVHTVCDRNPTIPAANTRAGYVLVVTA